MVRDSLAVPADATPVHHDSWDSRIREVAALATRLCRDKETVHSADCSISGSPDELIVNLACIATSEKHVPAMMLFANDTLLPHMERSLGIRFEGRNLQFAVVSQEIQAPAAARLEDFARTKDWLDLPFANPDPAAGISPRDARGSDIDLATLRQ